MTHFKQLLSNIAVKEDRKHFQNKKSNSYKKCIQLSLTIMRQLLLMYLLVCNHMVPLLDVSSWPMSR